MFACARVSIVCVLVVKFRENGAAGNCGTKCVVNALSEIGMRFSGVIAKLAYDMLHTYYSAPCAHASVCGCACVCVHV